MIGKVLGGLVVALVIIVGGNLLIGTPPRGAIVVAAEPIGLGPVSNAMFTSIILSVIILVLAAVVGGSLKEKPTGLQNIFEIMIEFLDGLIKSIAPKKMAPVFFPILATIFIYLLFCNWFSLLTPFLASFGFIHEAHGAGVSIDRITFLNTTPEDFKAKHASEHKEAPEGGHGAPAPEGGHGEAPAAEGAHAAEGPLQVMIVPIFRAPSSDLNLTFALALISVLLTQYFGLTERGMGYVGHFLRFDAIKKGPIGIIDIFVGLLELVSEVAKIISFSFRLFGNVFAGEVVLIVISSLVSLLVVLIFFGLEIFVGFIQAFVFFILSLVFFSMASEHHDHAEEHHHAGH